MPYHRRKNKKEKYSSWLRGRLRRPTHKQLTKHQIWITELSCMATKKIIFKKYWIHLHISWPWKRDLLEQHRSASVWYKWRKWPTTMKLCLKIIGLSIRTMATKSVHPINTLIQDQWSADGNFLLVIFCGQKGLHAKLRYKQEETEEFIQGTATTSLSRGFGPNNTSN